MYILDIIVKDWYAALVIAWLTLVLCFCWYLVWRLRLENQHKDKMDKLFAQYEEERAEYYGDLKYTGD